MEQDKQNPLAVYGVKSPEEKEKDLRLEAQLWEILEKDPDNQDHHKEYFNHTVRNGLLKEASRRYGSIIENPESYSIEARRHARYYQKYVVELMFMKPKEDQRKKRNPTGGYVFAFFSTILILIGLFLPKFISLTIFGAISLSGYIGFKVYQSKSLSKNSGSGPGSTLSQ